MQQRFIYNNPNAHVRLRIELNMTTEKKVHIECSVVLFLFPHFELHVTYFFQDENGCRF